MVARICKLQHIENGLCDGLTTKCYASQHREQGGTRQRQHSHLSERSLPDHRDENWLWDKR
jgi:hypothetical protein